MKNLIVILFIAMFATDSMAKENICPEETDAFKLFQKLSNTSLNSAVIETDVYSKCIIIFPKGDAVQHTCKKIKKQAEMHFSDYQSNRDRANKHFKRIEKCVQKNNGVWPQLSE